MQCNNMDQCVDNYTMFLLCLETMKQDCVVFYQILHIQTGCLAPYHCHLVTNL